MNEMNQVMDEELISIEDAAAQEGIGETDNNNTVEVFDDEFIDLAAYAENTEENNNQTEQTPNEQTTNEEPKPPIAEDTQKTLLDYVMEMAMQNLVQNQNNNEVQEQEPTQEAQPAEQQQPEETIEQKLPQTVQELLEEAKKIVFESRALEYAREQANAIQKEVNQLATLGIRVSNEEIQNIIQQALANGIEPIQAFKSYAYELVKIGAITGSPPTRLRQPLANRINQTPPNRIPNAPKYARPAEGEFIPLEDVILETFEE